MLHSAASHDRPSTARGVVQGLIDLQLGSRAPFTSVEIQVGLVEIARVGSLCRKHKILTKTLAAQTTSGRLPRLVFLFTQRSLRAWSSWCAGLVFVYIGLGGWGEITWTEAAARGAFYADVRSHPYRIVKPHV